jgi:hypothetical protein
MPLLPVGRCRSCDAPVSYFARTCPYCGAANLPNPVAIVTGLAGVLLLGGAITLAVLLVRGKAPGSAAMQSPAPGQGAEGKEDYGWLVQAMADCEEEAKLKPDIMYFLIVPVATTGVAVPGWSPSAISGIGDSGALLNSTDTLIGLRNHVFKLYEKPLTFAVSDPATKTVYKWKPATGVTALQSRDLNSASLTLGFEIPEVGKEVEWGPSINLKKGTCYWIMALIQPRPKPPPG